MELCSLGADLGGHRCVRSVQGPNNRGNSEADRGGERRKTGRKRCRADPSFAGTGKFPGRGV